MDFGVSLCLSLPSITLPPLLFFLQIQMKRIFGDQSEFNWQSMNEHKPMSSQWPLSLVGSWWDPFPVPTLAASGGISHLSAFYLSSAILFYLRVTTVVYAQVLTLLSQVSSLHLHYSKCLWSVWSRALGVPAAFLPWVPRAPKPSPLAPRGAASLLPSFCLWASNFLWLCFHDPSWERRCHQSPAQRPGLWSDLKVKVCYAFLRKSRRWPAGSQCAGSKKKMILPPLSLKKIKSFRFEQIILIYSLNKHFHSQP